MEKKVEDITYTFVKAMEPKEMEKLYDYLKKAVNTRRNDPETDQVATWKKGIQLCKDRMLELGYTFGAIRKGYVESFFRPELPEAAV